MEEFRRATPPVEIAKDQPVDMCGRSNQARNSSIETRRAARDHGTLRNQPNVPNQPFGYRNIGITLYGKVDDLHARAS